jgi:chaperone modulatory protein CbpM
MRAGPPTLVLSLIDQLYDTRQRLWSLTSAVTMQEKNIQAAIIAAMERTGALSGTGIS